MIIQTIQTEWSKESRGNPGATKRNATPEVLGFPLHEENSCIVWHRVQYFEPEFKVNEEIRYRDSGYKQFQHVVVDVVDEKAEIELNGRRRFSLSKGEIGSVVYNYAETIVVDDWYRTVYHKICLNLAYGVEFREDIFLKGFDKTERELRNLR